VPKLFAGLDVSDESTSVCLLDVAGNKIVQTAVPSTPTALAKILRHHRRFLVHVGQETGSKSAWLHKELSSRGFPMICLDARHAKAALAARLNKTDKNDAFGIATLLRRGEFTTAYIKSDEAIRIRLLLTARRTLLQKALDLQRRVRATVKSSGMRLRPKKPGAKRRLLGDGPDAMASNVISVMEKSSETLLAEVRVLDRLVVSAAKNDPVCRRLMTIPAVGPLTALAFRAAVDDPARFRSSRTVAAHFGLTPRTFQSGQTSFSGHISRFGDASVRTALYLAAAVLLNCSKSPWPLRTWGLRLAERKGFRIAAIACARKLAVVMHRVWISGGEFEPRPLLRTRTDPPSEV
jgi:transposase